MCLSSCWLFLAILVSANSHYISSRGIFIEEFGLGLDLALIRQTISKFPIAIDSKDFQSLDQVFTPDVKANYGGSFGTISGFSNLTRIPSLT